MADVQLNILLETKKATAAIENFSRQAQRSADKTQGSIKGINTSINQVGGAFKKTADSVDNIRRKFSNIQNLVGAVFAVDLIRRFSGAITGAVQATVDLGDETAKTADKLGVSIEALQELRFAAERSGIAAGTFDVALQRFTRRAAEAAQGTGEARAALKQLGVQLQDSNGQLRPAEDLLGDVADAFAAIPNQSEKVRLAFKLFDTEGVALVNLLNQGSISLDEFRERARQLGGVISEDTARAAEKFKDAQTDLNQAITGVRIAILSDLLPALTDLARGFTDFISNNRDLISTVIRNIPTAFKIAAQAIAGFLIVTNSARIAQFGSVLIDTGKQALTFAKSLGTKQILLYDASLRTASLGAKTLNIATKALRVSVNLFKNAALLGLPFILEEVITKFSGAQKSFGGFGNTLKAIGLNVKIGFLSAVKLAQEAIQGFIGLINKIPGVNISTDGITSSIRATNKEIEKTQKQIRGLIATPADAPYKQIEDGAKGAAGAARELTAEQRKLQEEAKRIVEAQALQQDPTLKFEQELEAIRMANEQKLITEEEFQAAKLSLEEQTRIAREQAAEKELDSLLARNELLRQLDEEANADEIARNKAKANALLAGEKVSQKRILEEKVKRQKKEQELDQLRVQQTSQVFGNLASLSQTGNKTLFAIGKAAAIAQSTINASQAITRALAEGGPFLGPILAASIAVKTGVEISKIASTNLQRGLTEVPGGFPNDTFPANLSSGERVVSSEQNRDLKEFISSNRSNGNMLAAILDRLGNLEGSISIQVGGRTIVETINDEIRGGRVIAV